MRGSKFVFTLKASGYNHKNIFRKIVSYIFLLLVCSTTFAQNDLSDPEISSPFYLNGWFIVVLIAGVLLTSILLVKWRAAIFKQRQKELEAEVEAKTREIHQKNKTIKNQSEKIEEMKQVVAQNAKPINVEEKQNLAFEAVEERLCTNAAEMLPPPKLELSLPKSEIRDCSKQRILVIEDNQEMMSFIRDCIDGTKYEIIEATNESKGIQKALDSMPDLIVTNEMVPGQDGFEITKSIRSNTTASHIPLILLSTKDAAEINKKALALDADAYLTQPFSAKDLSLRIAKLIETGSTEVLEIGDQKSDEDAPTTKNVERDHELVTSLKAYILEHIDETNLNGDVLGRQIGMSRVHLHRKLKALTNQTTSEFVRSIRLEKAVDLIKEGNLNISEISDKTGFSSISNFSRTFKKVYGKAPSHI